MKTPLRLLYLEDNLRDIELVRAALNRDGLEFELRAARDRTAFETALAEGPVDAILSDYTLPAYDGLTALRQARERFADTPFLLVSGPIGEDLAVECMRSGVTDCVLKHRLERLGPALRRALQEAEARASRQDAESANRQLLARLLKVQDEERRHLARELHDAVGQSLSALKMNLAAAQREVPQGNGTLQDLLTDCAGVADDATRTIRTLSYVLHPPTLDLLGLPGALRDLVEGFSRRSGILIELTMDDGFGRLPSDVETALFRVVQECLTNIHRHSESRSASIALRRTAAAVSVEVRDSGHGILPHLTGPSAGLGVGIAGMRERLRLLEGHLEIEGAASGTHVRATVPLKDNERINESVS